jgi:predicted secreted hydrolase
VRLRAGDFTITPGRVWRSPASGAEYPVAWRIELPNRGVSIAVEAALESQELRTERSTGVTYWEGSVVARGRSALGPLQGRGYLEMTGYAGAPMSDVLR